MIELPVEWVLAVPLFAGLILLFAGAVYYAWRWDAGRADHGRPFIYQCSACGRVYLNRRQIPMLSCPRCGNLNPAARR